MIHADALSKIGMNPDALKKGVGRVMQKPWHVQAHHEVIVDHDKCTGCGLCIGCDYGALEMHPLSLKEGEQPLNPQRLIKPQVAETLGKAPAYEKKVVGIDENCVGCDWCISVCPTDALTIVDKRRSNNHAYWDNWSKDNVRRQANTGAKLLVSMGAEGTSRSREPYQQRILDYLRFDAAQVTNPSIDPLREPMELRTYLGGKPSDPSEPLPPQLKLDLPFMIAHMSFGALSPHAVMACAMAAKQLGIIMGTGEGGLYEGIRPYGDHIVVQVASGRFGVDPDFLNAGCAVSIKIGQGAKPGIGGHLPGEKVSDIIARTRGIPTGSDALSPAPHHDIYSIEDLRQLIYAIKEATNYKPVEVKIAATHNVDFIASGIARAGADIISIDGYRGSTGAAPQAIRDHVGVDIEVAISLVDLRLRSESHGYNTLRDRVSLIAAGGVKNSADALKLIMLGADAVSVGTAVLMCMGCTTCGTCNTNHCNYGICTTKPYLFERLDPEKNAQRVANLFTAWAREIKEFLGAMGLSTIEGARGNRERLRGLGLPEKTLEILGVRAA